MVESPIELRRRLCNIAGADCMKKLKVECSKRKMSAALNAAAIMKAFKQEH